MEKLYKQFAEWVTRWQINNRIDEFFSARLGLTVYYLTTAIIILGGSSIITYNAILYNLTQSILERGFDPNVSQIIIADAQSILLNRFLIIDSIIMIFTVLLGFLLTNKTLKPIRVNMLKQKRFIADASHELRTPTTVIISGLEVALSNKKLDFNLAKKTLEDTLEEMREFSKLSNSLLDISKYDSPIHIQYEHVHINELVKYIVEKNKNLAQAKNINIEMKIGPSVIIHGNEIELSRVFLNILDNAIKHTPDGGSISVFDKVDSNKYIVTIFNSGPGIKEDTLQKIFEPFFRGDASRSTNGVGLGLTLSKKIIENHKGTIYIKSQINKGTTATISLPIA